MHDLNYFRDHLDVFAEMAKKRGAVLDLDAFRELDKERRELITATEQLKARRNKASEEIARLKKEKQSADSLLAEMKLVSERIKQSDERIAELDNNQRELLLTIPNVPHSSVPVGTSAADNTEVRRWGTAPKFDFVARPHWEVGESAGILDLPAATKITGARFAVYKGWGARLERALANFFLDVHTREHGYTEILPPFLVNTASLTGAGQLPKFAADLFKIQDTDFWLTPTSEVELHNLYRDETIPEEKLPLRVTAWTACFRSEAGAAGKDTRGILRQHQFQKVELFKFTHPEKSYEEHEALTRNAEAILQKTWFALSHGAALHRRHGLCLVKNIRHRSLVALQQRIPRNFLLLELRSVSVPARRHSLQAQGRRQERLRSHFERFRAGRWPHLDRRRGELSAAGWLNLDS